jgi:hypothetical protein
MTATVLGSRLTRYMSVPIHERLIAGKHGDHERLSFGNNSDPQGDNAFMSYDKHRYTYDDNDGDDDDDNPIDGNDIDTTLTLLMMRKRKK